MYFSAQGGKTWLPCVRGRSKVAVTANWTTFLGDAPWRGTEGCVVREGGARGCRRAGWVELSQLGHQTRQTCSDPFLATGSVPPSPWAATPWIRAPFHKEHQGRAWGLATASLAWEQESNPTHPKPSLGWGRICIHVNTEIWNITKMSGGLAGGRVYSLTAFTRDLSKSLMHHLVWLLRVSRRKANAGPLFLLLKNTLGEAGWLSQ